MNPTKIMTFLGASLMAISAGAGTYQIQEGDTLSDIIYKKNIKPIYGKFGYLQKIIHLNKSVIRGDGSFIRIGDFIELPDDETLERPIAQIEKDQKKVNVRRPSSIHKELNDNYPYSYFRLSPNFSSLKINSVNQSKFGGTNTTIFSKTGVGIDASWNISYDEKKTYFGFASMEYYTLFSDPNIHFNRSSLTRFHFGAGAKAQCLPDFELIVKASVREVGFLDVTTPANVDVNSLILTEFDAAIKQTFATKKDFSAKVGGHILGLLPGSVGSYHSKLGYGAGALFELQHANKSMSVNYDYRSLKINEIKNTEGIISLIMNFSLGNSL